MLARRARMKVRGDFGLNLYNSWALATAAQTGLLSVTASFELRLSQIRDLAKCADTEMIVYGRLPLMVSDQCVIKQSAGRCTCQTPAQLSDRMFDRALMGAYAPGSTFKPCTAIAALTEGKINTSTTIVCNGVFTKYADTGFAPKCWIYSSYGLTHGAENVTTAIRDSCNIFFYTVGDELGIDKLDKYAAEFGLGESTGIELAETKGNMANPETHKKLQGVDWYNGDTVTAAIGQSDSLFTPLQIAEYCATVANGGTRYTASILKTVRTYDYGTTVYTRDNEVLSTVDSPDYNWKAVQQGMNKNAQDVMMGAPSTVEPKQLDELHIAVTGETEE